MTSPAFEAFLARLYVDKVARDQFLKDRLGEARQGGLTLAECEALLRVDADDLRLAANSFERKRRNSQSRRAGFLNQILESLRTSG